MTDDELKTRLRHSADVLRDMLYDDLAEGCSRTVQRIDALRAELDRAFDELGMLGVPRERARTVANGINVLMTRISKSEVAMLSELEAARADAGRMREAILAIVQEPHGCRFCDSGRLRSPNNPEKGHDHDCGYLLAIDAARKERT